MNVEGMANSPTDDAAGVLEGCIRGGSKSIPAMGETVRWSFNWESRARIPVRLNARPVSSVFKQIELGG